MYVARGTRHEKLERGVGYQPVVEVLLLLSRRPRLIRNLTVLHHTQPRGDGPESAQGDDGTWPRGVALDVPVSRPEGLPDSVQVGPAIRGAWGLIGSLEGLSRPSRLTTGRGGGR